MVKVTQHVGGKSVSEKSQVTRTSKNLFEKSNSKTQYFVREVKDRRMTKNRVEFLIGWCDLSLVDVDSVETELNDYTRLHQVPLDTDPLMWWNQHVQEFPHLNHMTR